MKKLTPKQQRFVEEYPIDCNSRQAAIRSGYSAKTAEWIGPQLLKKNHVLKAIQVKREEQAKAADISVEWILNRLREEAMPSDDSNAPGPRVKALELLGKRVGLFPDKIVSDNRHTIEIVYVNAEIPD